MEATNIPEGLQAQRDYIKKHEESKLGFPIAIGDAFVRGMRDIGYKSTAFALAEILDNSIEAGATHVDVVFDTGKHEMVEKIAVADNGYGMEPVMTRLSLIWGAGTRTHDRRGFGKYGYGLPTASVSQCTSVSVFSKTPGGVWHKAVLDLDDIRKQTGSIIEVPKEVAEEPPAFVRDAMKKNGRWPMEHGTVVVWNGQLDRVNPRQLKALKARLLNDLGVIYRKFLENTPMYVNGTAVDPVDPLFLTPGFRYYDLDSDRAVALDPAVVEVTDKKTGEVVGRMRVRFSSLPATFFRKPEAKHNNKPGKSSINERLDIADANNGIIFCRNGRQIDVLKPPRRLFSINATTDRFWGIEVDFDASLDDQFAITTSKQQVVPDDAIWDMLKDKANIFANIGVLRKQYKKSAMSIAAEAEKAPDGERASVEAINRARKFKTTKAPKDTPERKKEAEANLDREAEQRAKKSGLETSAVRRELEAHQQGRELLVEVQDFPGAPFFNCEQRGGTRVLYLNSAHPFYTELYMGADSTPRVRAALEVVLWALGEAEVDADVESDRRKFYERERSSVWSPYVADALNELKNITLIEATDVEVDEASDDDAA